MRIITAILLLLLHGVDASSQNISDSILTKIWKAFWIQVPGAPPHDYGVYNFRKDFDLKEKPSQFIVHVSADNRYKLFVNGQFASFGPARGDIYHWNFETVDIAQYLHPGKNSLAAVVWNFGEATQEA